MDTSTGKPLKKARKTKTKVVKKTLNPVWTEDEVIIGHCGVCPTFAQSHLIRPGHDEQRDAWGRSDSSSSPPSEFCRTAHFPLVSVGSMKTPATGSVTFRCAIVALHTAEPSCGRGAETPLTAKEEEEKEEVSVATEDKNGSADAKDEDVKDVTVTAVEVSEPKADLLVNQRLLLRRERHCVRLNYQRVRHHRCR